MTVNRIIFSAIIFLVGMQLGFSQIPYKSYWDNGNLKTEGQKKYGKNIGNWKSYYETGELKQEYSYTDGKYNIVKTQYYKDGTVEKKTTKENDKFIIREYRENATLLSEQIHKTGYYKEFTEDGILKIEATYDDWELVGDWIEYYADGSIKWLVNYKDHYRHGDFKAYHKNGNLKAEGTFKKDKRDGNEKHYNSDGKLILSGKYKEGKPKFPWKKYDPETENVTEKPNSESKFGIELSEVPDGVFAKAPIFPGCENELGNKLKKDCNRLQIQKIVNKNFNTDIALNYALTGVLKIYTAFTISKDGTIKNIKARAKLSVLEKEATRVISLIPNMKPATVRGKKVDVTYNLPIVFQVK